MRSYPPAAALWSDGGPGGGPPVEGRRRSGPCPAARATGSGLRPSPSGRQSAARIPSYPPGIARGASSHSQARGTGASPSLRCGRMVETARTQRLLAGAKAQASRSKILMRLGVAPPRTRRGPLLPNPSLRRRSAGWSS
jgi:hypothetical protein